MMTKDEAKRHLQAAKIMLLGKDGQPISDLYEAICVALDAIDAVPVVHGEWIIKPHGTYGQLRAFCSACGKHSGIGGIVSNQKKPYCPNCGAIMDGKEDK